MRSKLLSLSPPMLDVFDTMNAEFSFRFFLQMGVAERKLRKVVLAADVERFYPVAKPDRDDCTCSRFC